MKAMIIIALALTSGIFKIMRIVRLKNRSLATFSAIHQYKLRPINPQKVLSNSIVTIIQMLMVNQLRLMVYRQLTITSILLLI